MLSLYHGEVEKTHTKGKFCGNFSSFSRLTEWKSHDSRVADFHTIFFFRKVEELFLGIVREEN